MVQLAITYHNPDSKVHGTNMAMLAPWTLLLGNWLCDEISPTTIQLTSYRNKYFDSFHTDENI